MTVTNLDLHYENRHKTLLATLARRATDSMEDVAKTIELIARYLIGPAPFDVIQPYSWNNPNFLQFELQGCITRILITPSLSNGFIRAEITGDDEEACAMYGHMFVEKLMQEIEDE